MRPIVYVVVENAVLNSLEESFFLLTTDLISILYHLRLTTSYALPEELMSGSVFCKGGYDIRLPSGSVWLEFMTFPLQAQIILRRNNRCRETSRGEGHKMHSL